MERQNQKVLAVNESEPNLHLLEPQQEKPNHNIKLTNTESKAIVLFQTNDFDLVLIDIQMLEMHGVKASRMMSQTGGSLARIIDLMAQISPDEQKECLETGMNEVIIKFMRISNIRAVPKPQHNSTKLPV